MITTMYYYLSRNCESISRFFKSYRLWTTDKKLPRLQWQRKQIRTSLFTLFSSGEAFALASHVHPFCSSSINLRVARTLEFESVLFTFEFKCAYERNFWTAVGALSVCVETRSSNLKDMIFTNLTDMCCGKSKVGKLTVWVYKTTKKIEFRKTSVHCSGRIGRV